MDGDRQVELGLVAGPTGVDAIAALYARADKLMKQCR